MPRWIEMLLGRARRRAEKARVESSPRGADNPAHGVETDDRALAQPSAAGAGAHPARADSAQRDREHGVRGRTGEPGGDGGGTRAPRSATRYVETRLGVLSYAALAPHLARNVLALEKRIEDGEFSALPLDDALLLRFHALICGDLVQAVRG